MTLSLPTLPARSREAVENTQTHEHFPAGAHMMREGDVPDQLFAIKSGTVAVVRSGADGTEHKIAELGEGELVGELSFLDGAPRSASVRALTPVEAVSLSADALCRSEAGRLALADLKAAIAATVAGRMRAHNDRYVEALEDRVRTLNQQREFGLFYIYSISMMAMVLIIDAFITRRIFDIDATSALFSWQYLIALMLPMAGVLYFLRIPLFELGVTRVGLRKSLLEGLGLGILLGGIVLFLAPVALAPLGFQALDPHFRWTASLLYLAHSFLQELFARGFVQTSLKRFLDDERGVRSVLLASFMFGLFHIQYGFLAIAITGVAGILFGFIYLRHRNVAGVTIVHFCLGEAAFAIGLL